MPAEAIDAAAISLNSADASRSRADSRKIKPELLGTRIMSYFPPQHPADWQRSAPEAAGLDPSGLAAATRCAAEHETPWGRDLAQVVERDFNEEPPWNEALGPVRPRGGPNGLVLRGGRIVAEWGDTTQIDQTFSVAKSYLSILAGLAWDRGLFRDLYEPVRRSPDVGWAGDSGA